MNFSKKFFIFSSQIALQALIILFINKAHAADEAIHSCPEFYGYMEPAKNRNIIPYDFKNIKKFALTEGNSTLTEENRVEAIGRALYETYFKAKATNNPALRYEAESLLKEIYAYGKKSKDDFWADFARPSFSDISGSNAKLVFNFRYNLLDKIGDPKNKAALLDKIIAANQEVLAANKELLDPKLYLNYLESMLSESARILNKSGIKKLSKALQLDFISKLMKLSSATNFRGSSTYQDDITKEILGFLKKVPGEEDPENLTQDIQYIVIHKGEQLPPILSLLGRTDFSSSDFLANFAAALKSYKKEAQGNPEKIRDILFYVPNFINKNTVLSDKSKADVLGYLLNEMILSNVEENLHGSMFERMITKDLLDYGKKTQDPFWANVLKTSEDGVSIPDSTKLSLAYHYNFLKNEQFAKSNITIYRTMANTAVSTLENFAANSELTAKSFTDYISSFVEQGLDTINNRALQLSYKQRPIEMIQQLFAIARGADIKLSKEQQKIVFDALYRYCQKFYKNGRVSDQVNIKLYNFVGGEF